MTDKSISLKIKSDTSAVKTADKWRYSYAKLTNKPIVNHSQTHTQIQSRAQDQKVNPYIEPGKNIETETSQISHIKSGFAKEWLDTELDIHDVVVLIFVESNKEALDRAIRYAEYFIKNGLTVRCVCTESYDLVKKTIKSKHIDFVYDSKFELSCRCGTTIINVERLLENIVVYAKKTDFKISTAERYSYPDIICCVRKIKSVPNSNNEFNREFNHEFNYELTNPSYWNYVSVFGGKFTDFDQSYTNMAILNTILTKEQICKVTKVSLERIKEDNLLVAKKDMFKESAIKRIMKDYVEIIKNPIDGIKACPVSDSNIFEWHVDLNAPNDILYENVVFHLVIFFSPLYPLRPPTIKMKSQMVHPNIFGEYICLDLLTEYYKDENESNEINYGWSTAYSLYSILITLRAFINDGLDTVKYGPDKEFSNYIEQWNEGVTKQIKKINKFYCTCDRNVNLNTLNLPSLPVSQIQSDSLNSLNKSTYVINFDNLEKEYMARKRIQKNKNSSIDSNPSDPKYSRYKPLVNQVLNCIIKKVMDFGAFVELNLLDIGKIIKLTQFNERYFNSYNLSCFVPLSEYSTNSVPKTNSVTKIKILGFNTKPSTNKRDSVKLIGSLKELDLDTYQKVQLKIKSPIQTVYHEDNINSTFLKDNLVCFHSKKTFEETTLGIGVTVEYYDNGDVSYINPCLDLISYESFYEQGVRKGAWKDKFDKWIPLYISESHAKNLTLHEKFISLICMNKNSRESKNLDNLYFNPHMVLKVLPVLMNTFIVMIMKDNMHESVNALSMYTQIYRLLLAFIQKYPELMESIDVTVYSFIKDPDFRVKKEIPSLGEFIPLLLVSSFDWVEVAEVLLSEMLDRNVKWLVQEYPELGKLNELKANVNEVIKLNDPSIDIEEQRVKLRKQLVTSYQKLSTDEYNKLRLEINDKLNNLDSQIKLNIPSVIDWNTIDRCRITKTFKTNQTSFKLVAFHYEFLKMFKFANVSETLDKTYGLPSTYVENQFQESVKKIKQIDNFSSFFRSIQIPVPTNEDLLKLLRQSVLNSFKKRYHVIKAKIKPTLVQKKTLLPTLNTDDL